MIEQTLELTRGGRQLIQNNVLLGNCIGFKPQFMAHAANQRNALQREKDIKGRTVYSSGRPLSYIQQRLGRMLSEAFEELESNEAAIAYRKGVDVRKLLAGKCAGSSVVIKTDIRRYYDHVSRSRIKLALGGVGFVENGPDVVSRYLVVSRWVPVGEGSRKIETLQQGSAASPAVSNIVGREVFDIPIGKWLEENCVVPYRLFRYSDNIALFLDEEPGWEFIRAYKRQVRRAASQAGFSTHAWATLRRTNPARAQEFLGLVLNRIANVPRHRRDWFRAVLFGAIIHDMFSCGEWWCREHGIDGENVLERFAASVKGFAAYVASVNPKHGKRLQKLAALIGWLVENPGRKVDRSRLDIVKAYRRDRESIERYLEAAKAAFASA